MAWCLVTPASRGIGLALTRRLLQVTPPSVPIVATARSNLESVKSQILADLPDDGTLAASRLDVQHCDLQHESSIAQLADYCADRYQRRREGDSKATPPHLRTAFLIPGMLHPEKSPGQISHEHALATLKLNILAPMLLVKHLSRFLPRKSATLTPVPGLHPDTCVTALMSARVGSITDNRRGGWYSYRASKAAVAQLVKTFDHFLRVQSGPNAVCVGLHPGTVKTSLSRDFWHSTPPDKLFEPDFAARRLVEVLAALDVEEGRGGVWDWKGELVPP